MKTGVSLPDEVYAELTRIARAMGYTSISKAVRDAVEAFIAFNRWWTASGRVFGALQVLVSRPSALEKLLHVEASFESIIRASLQIPSKGYTLILIVVEGEGSEVKEMYKQLTRIDGVLAVQASLLPALTSASGTTPMQNS